MSSIPVIKFQFRTEWPALDEALKLNPDSVSEVFDSASELATYLSSNQATMVIASIVDKNDLIQLATLMKLSKKLAGNSVLKFVGLNYSSDKQFEKALGKLGILDIIDAQISTKALKFKIDFWMKSMNGQLRKMNLTKPSSSIKSYEANKTQEQKSSDQTPFWTSPLDCEDDIWILKSDSDCKRILSRWLVKLMGPSPYVGQWTEVEGQQTWLFELRPENKELFTPGSGQWLFRGSQKPDFIWKENLWLITGESFELFYKDNEQTFSRLKLKERTLYISKNSEYAKTKESTIIESFDKEIIQRADLQESSARESLDAETERLNNLQGKGKTEKIKKGPLSGTNSSQEQQSGLLKGKINQNEVLDSNQNSTSSSGLKRGEELSSENNHSHRKYYKSHNEAEEYQAKELSLNLKKESPKGNLDGASGTDNLSSFYSSESKEKRTQPEKKGDEKSFFSNPKLNPKLKSESFSDIETLLEVEGETDQKLEEASQDARVISYLTQKNVSVACELDDFFERTIIFITQETNSLQKSQVNLDLTFEYLNKSTQLKMDGQILSIEADGEGQSFVTIEVSGDHASSFDRFMKLYKSRQNNVDYFLKKAKGL